jgi:hypothetical protein
MSPAVAALLGSRRWPPDPSAAKTLESRRFTMSIDIDKLTPSQRALWDEYMTTPLPPGVTELVAELQFREICALEDEPIDQPCDEETVRLARDLQQYLRNLRAARGG